VLVEVRWRINDVLVRKIASLSLPQRYKVDAVQEAHIGKNKKCGILPFVQDFEDFVELAESIFRDSERRTDIDKAYKTLIEAVFEASAYDIIAAVFGICFNLRFSSREF